ncbi:MULTISPECIES: helix-turn-helix domain-containing protein [Bacillati]|uniref:helix-turn-helix domain-containing protein n=1 Tax=Bacillati TaxID=1783272 RepID=UPI001D061BC2|nr:MULTISPECIES: helix-turn-helix transcriptional regulator [Terrabacteria group]DAL93481.1 MAG TPA: helix-turn-helix domain protein [Caudoviricetes sp.]DAY20868.1 MAG TPA: helix-turn-helix domain protein [Bacteriophage sp.]MCB7040258.1 helix-turn-helix domain-containing protein [Flavonifractor plautii]MCG4705747.1 helix-turn-helix domain-containing protein [Flavonifractor plautii]MEE0703036.1 helix-turn-helix transcriptional regulator [Collinsella sp.]
MNERIKAVRLALGISQEEFGKRLGVTRGAITNIELNKVEPKPLFVDLICREFNVNEDWLKNGAEPMFLQRSRNEELSAFFGDLLNGEPDFKHRLISVMSRLSVDQWQMLADMANMLVEEMQKEKPSPE